MRISLIPILGFLALSSAQFAHADNLVNGSTFDVALYTTSAYNDYTVTVGTPFNFTYGNTTGTITEQETTASNGQDIFTFTILGATDLFPVSSTGEGLIGIGTFTPLQFSQPFDLTAATQAYIDTTTNAASSFNAYPSVQDPDPFSSYAGPGTIIGYTNTAGKGYNEVVVTLQGNAVTPEPSSIALLGTGLLGIVGVFRRRTRSCQ